MAKVVNIKCPNCGANLDLEENKTIATCQYCKADLKIEKDINDIIEAHIITGTKIAKGVFYYVLISFIVTITISIAIAISISSFARRNHNSFDKSKFNSSFTYSAGAKTGIFVNDTLDSVIRSNKENKKQIYVKYNDIKTNKEEDIIAIEDEIDTFNEYHVSIDYDKDGYVNLVTIK